MEILLQPVAGDFHISKTSRRVSIKLPFTSTSRFTKHFSTTALYIRRGDSPTNSLAARGALFFLPYRYDAARVISPWSASSYALALIYTPSPAPSGTVES